MPRKIFTTQSCLIIFCVALMSLTVPAGAYAGGKAVCPCFNANKLNTYSSSDSAVTTSRYVESTGTFPASGYVVSRSDVDAVAVDQCLDIVIDFFGSNLDTTLEEKFPEASYDFSVIVSDDGSGSCGAFYVNNAGDTVYTSEQTSSAQSGACIDLLDQARDNDLAVMTTLSVGGGDKGPDR